MSRVKLDRRPARTDLTSREAAKIVGAVLGNLLAAEVGRAETPAGGVHAARHGLRVTLAVLERSASADEAAQQMIDSAKADPAVAAAASFIGGVAAGLSELAPPENVRTALRWYDQDEVWDALVTQTAQAGAAFMHLVGREGDS